jgi:hypothetical protein
MAWKHEFLVDFRCSFRPHLETLRRTAIMGYPPTSALSNCLQSIAVIDGSRLSIWINTASFAARYIDASLSHLHFTTIQRITQASSCRRHIRLRAFAGYCSDCCRTRKWKVAMKRAALAKSPIHSGRMFRFCQGRVPRTKRMLTKWWQHRESQRVLKDCLQLSGGILKAAKDPGSLFQRQRVERINEQSRKSLWLFGK